VNNSLIKLAYIPTNKIAADGFTKLLLRLKH
jgi:hypothetical protein